MAATLYSRVSNEGVNLGPFGLDVPSLALNAKELLSEVGAEQHPDRTLSQQINKSAKKFAFH